MEIDVTPSGMVTEVKFEHPSKELLKISLTVLGIVTVVSDKHSKNAEGLMDVILVGKDIEVNPECAKAPSPMLVTL